ncbi:MAG TPA: acyl-CoA dehydrogenase family protein [Acidimicrobiales bacterium]|nr:acyl-CoA dehydrogenase family protein [Acidimicrobiales bacterium]
MDLSLTDDQQLFRETTRKFLEDTCPLAEVRRIADEEPDGFDRGWWRRGAELGWVSMLVAEEHGGGCVSGQPLADLALAVEEMGRLVSPGPVIPTNVVAAALSRVGAPDQHKHLAGLVAGETVAAWCPGVPFPGTGRRHDAANGEVVAEAGGEGYLLSGTSGPVEAGGQADLWLVSARSGEGVSQFVVPSGTPGVTVLPAQTTDLVRRFACLRFDQVDVVADALLGEAAAAGADVERQLQDAAVLQCAEMAGATDRVFEFTVEYAEDRYSFGRPLVSYQALKHRFADMKMWLEASHASVTGAARAVDSGSPLAPEMISVAKSYIGDHLPFVIQECVQLHGGIGVTWDHDLHLYLRRVVEDRARFGTPRDHRERVAQAVGL